MNDRELANALEALLRSEVWREVERRLVVMREEEVLRGMGAGVGPFDRAEAAGAYQALQQAIDLPGNLYEQLRSRET